MGFRRQGYSPLSVRPYAPAVFYPTQISGLTLWLKADAGVFQSTGGAAAAADNDVVGEWQDQSGNGLHFTQATTINKPKWRTNRLNGLPSIQFDGNDFVQRASVVFSSLIGNNAATIFAVMYQDSTDAQGSLFGGDSSGGANLNLLRLHATYDDVIYYDYGASGSGGRISVAQPAGWDNAYHVLELFRSGASGNIRSDGVSRLSASFTDDLDSTASTTFYIGRDVFGTAHTGFLVDFLVYNRALNSSERGLVRTYLTARTGLAA